MNFVSKFDAKLPADSFGAHSNAHAHFETVSPHPSHIPSGAIIVPDTQLLFNGEFKRSGVDLILSKDDHELVLQDYFKGEKRAALASPDGAQLTGDIVSALTGHVEYAQAGGAPAAAAVIGHVTKLVGSATAIRNGVSIILNNGDNVEKGDVVQSGSDSTLGVTFIDGTVFGLSSNARMVLNEMVYDPNGSNNSSLLSLVAGTITFVAGETAKHGDMKVDTPVATMGIRGTAVLVEIDFSIPGALAAPDTKFQVLVEPDGTTGRYILFDKNTLTPIAEVNQAGQQIHIHQGIVSITNEALPPDVQKLITDVFAQKFTDNSNPKSLEHFTDSITPQQQTPIVLPNGTTATPVVLLVKTADNSGVSGITGPTSLLGHIPGSPLVAILDPSGHVAKSFSFGELPGQTGDAQPDHIVVQINWVDINPGDVPTVTVAVDKNAYVYHDAHGNDVTTSLNALQIADIRAVELDFKPNPDAGNNNNGFATWTYSVADSNFDFLAAGETLTLTYNVTVQNNFAGNNETTTQSFTVTITGTNDRPVITSAAPAVAFTGDVQAGGFLAPTDPVTGKAVPASGILAFTDPDLTDTHLVTVSLKTPVWSGGAVPPTPLAAFEAALTARIGTDSTGTGNGIVTWQLAKLPDFLADFLPKGETLTLTYTITVTDSLGATATKDVTVTLTHVDPPDVAWIHPTDGLWSDGANWETGNVPTASDDVVIPDEQVIGGTGKYAVTITSDEVGTKAVAAKSVTLDAANTTGAKLINEGTLTVGAEVPAGSAGGQLELLITSVLQNSGTIKLTHGGDFKDQSSATNSGTIDVSGGTLNVLVNVDNTGGNLTVDGPATLTVQGATINNAVPPSVITGAVTEGATVTKNGTITNNGKLNLNGDGVLQNGSLGNFGQINVNGSGNALDGVNVTANKALEIFADGALLLDLGTQITNTYGTTTKLGGTITVDSAATLTLDGATINNGATGGGIFINALTEGAAVTKNGTITNNGTLNLNGDGVLQNGSLGNFGQINVNGFGNALDGVNVTANNALEIFADGALLLDQGTYISNGATTVDSGGTLTLDGIDGATIDGGSVTININGTLFLDGNGVLQNGSLGNSGQIIVNGSGNALDAETITNLGTIKVDGGALTIDSAVSFTNSGTLEAVNGGTLTLIATTVSDAATGVTMAGAASHIDLQGATLLQHTVSTEVGGEIDTVGGTSNTINTANGVADLTGRVNNAGILAITDNSSLTLISAAYINNTGTIELNSTGHNTYLYIDQGFAGFDGGGHVTLSDDTHNIIAAIKSGDQLTNNNNTISGAGEIGRGGLVLVNNSNGVIDANGKNALKLDTLSLTNTGTLEATNGATLLINTTVTNYTGSGLGLVNGTIAAVGDPSGTAHSSIGLQDAKIFGGNISITAQAAIVATSGVSTINGAASITNSAGTLEANGAELDLVNSTVNNTSGLVNGVNITGIVYVTGTNGTIKLEDATISGGGVYTTGASDTVESTSGVSAIKNAATVSNAGTLAANGGELDLIGETVSNSGGTLEAVNGSLLVLNSTTVNNGGGAVEAVDSVAQTSSTVDLQNATINGGTVATISDGIINAAAGTNAINGAIVNNAGTLESTGGTLTIDSASTVNNTGVLEANGGSLIVGAAFSGNAQIIGASLLELGADSTVQSPDPYGLTKIAFTAASTGTLELDHSNAFHGTVSGLDDNTLDLRDINYLSSPTVRYAGNASGGTLSIFVGGVDVSDIKLTGDYTGVHWALANDGSSQHGTDVTEIPGAISAGLDPNGNPSEGSAITAVITDGGKSVTNAKYEWQIQDAPNHWIDGSGTGVTSANYTPGETDEGHALRVSLTFTDANGNTDHTTVSAGTVNPVSDTPTVTVPDTSSAAIAVDENKTVPITGVSVTPAAGDEDDPVAATLSVAHGTLHIDDSSLPGDVTLTSNGTGTVIVSGLATDVNTVLKSLSYTPSGEYEGSDALHVTATSTDGGAAPSGPTGDQTVALTVNPVADAPALSGLFVNSVADDFSGATLDPTKWHVYVPTINVEEHHDGSVTQSGGALHIQDRGILQTVAGFTPTSATPLHTSFTWSFAEGGDYLVVTDRTDGATEPTFGGALNGISFVANWRIGDPGALLINDNATGQSVRVDASLNPGTVYDVSITDDGAHQTFVIKDHASGQTVASATGSFASVAAGNLVTITNREGNGDTHLDTIDNLSISNAYHGLEDGTVTLAGLTGLTDTDASDTLALKLSGFPPGATFSVGALGTGADDGHWVISASQMASLGTSPLTMTPPIDYNGNFTLHVDATVTDPAVGGATDTKNFTNDFAVTVDAVNDATFSLAGLNQAGNAVEDQQITAVVTDTDAPASGIVYTFQSFDGAHWNNVQSGSSASYTPTEAVEGSPLQVKVSYTDGHNNAVAGTVAAGTVAEAPAGPTSFATTFLHFDGNAFASGPVATTHVGNGANDGVTLAGWVDWNGGGSNYQDVFYNGSTSDAGFGVFGLVTSSGLDLQILIGGQTFLDTGFKLAAGQWHNIALTHVAGSYTLYVDGVADFTAQAGANGIPGPAHYPDFMTIGGDGGENFTGSIGDVSVWNAALTQSQIQALEFTALSGSEANLAAYYPLNDSSGTTAKDLVNSAGNLTLHGSAVWQSGDATIALGGLAGGNAVQDQKITASVTDQDAPSGSGATFTYTWTVGGQTVGDSGNTYTPTEADEGKAIAVSVTFTDTHGNAQAGLTSAGTVQESASNDLVATANATQAAEGAQINVTGVTDGGIAVTAGLTYAWQVFDGANWATVSTNSFYAPTEGDEGKSLQVVTTYNDQPTGNSEQTINSFGTIADITPKLTAPFSYSVDELKIVKGGSVVFDDTFSQAPPAGGTFGGTPVGFTTIGSTWTEVNGKAVMASTGAVALSIGGAQVIARLQTNTQDEAVSNGGLKENSTFAVSATFDLTAPKFVGQQYGIDLNDSTATHANDEMVQLIVANTGLGGVKVELVQADYSTTTFNVIASQTLSAAQLSGNTQIQLDLSHLTANSSAITGSFELLNSGVQTSTQTFGVTGHVFNNVTYTRVDTFAYAPDQVAITGVVTESQKLTANVTTNDSDASIHYQWQSSANGSTNWGNIGTDSSQYTLGEADEGLHIRVVATTSDPDKSSTAQVTSAATALVAESPSENATIALTGLDGSNNAVANQKITANVTDADAPTGSGATFTYTWTVGGQKVAGDTGNTYTPTEVDEGKAITVGVSFTDTHGNTETGLKSAGTVAAAPPVAHDDAISNASPPSGNGWVLDTDNGHYYRFVGASSSASWTQAQTGAASDGAYLATITSAAENSFISHLIGNGQTAWTAGDTTNASPGGHPHDPSTWTWTAGPEAGTLFTYTNWNPGEPNGGFGSSNAAMQISANGTWNDVPITWQDAGYLEEWGGLPNQIAFNENTGTTLTAAQLLANVTDIDNSALTITSVGDQSGHSLHGGTVNLNGNIITYTPAANYSGADTFAYTVSDDGVTSTAHVTFNVAALNDAPVVTISTAALATNESTPLAINGISVSDGDAGTAQIEVTLAVAHGTVTLENAAGLDSVAGNVSGSVNLFGSQTAIDTALAHGIIYTPTSGYYGSDTLNVTANDQGHTGAGGAQTTTQHIALTVNDGPVIETDQFSIVSKENGTTTISGLKVSDSDPAASSEIFKVTATTTGPGSTVTPETNSDTLGQTNEDLAEGVIYDPGSTPPATDKVTVTVADSFGATDTVNFIFNLANPPQTTPVVLTGTAGKDVIFGTGYGDILTGGGGQDQFVFKPNSGTNVAQHQITDFVDGLDKIDIRQFTNISAATLPAAEHQQGNDTLIKLDSHDTLLLKNTLIANLHNSDFIFHV
ncbi:FecR family protein [Bradyrhizobium lablabi]|uniref:FecR family protein n=1 Tax=Bradyrhizobium lablabi TaxID=722472 RepID=A0A1M6RSK2_9BRAD|nr:LamG-like jellyroll fold domain-containing protein [Bradyrhizobium lablabi]SHK35502.1 FecR family protein [Bradyrhizobium lablabi]